MLAVVVEWQNIPTTGINMKDKLGFSFTRERGQNTSVVGGTSKVRQPCSN